MGTWSIWHFAVFIIVTSLGVLSTRLAIKKGLNNLTPEVAGYGGWLIVLSAFLLFWAAQELGEFYRVKNQIGLLMPSALDNPQYQKYISYALSMAWCEAILLLFCVIALIGSRSAGVIKAVIAALWIAGPVSATAELVLAESYFGDYIVEHDFSALAATILFATTMTCYLLTSQRVRKTYGKSAKVA